MSLSAPSTTTINIDVQIQESESVSPVHAALPSWHTHSTVTGEQIQGHVTLKSTEITQLEITTTDTQDSGNYLIGIMI